MLPEGRAQRDYVNPSEASEVLRTEGAISNQVRKWWNITRLCRNDVIIVVYKLACPGCCGDRAVDFTAIKCAV